MDWLFYPSSIKRNTNLEVISKARTDKYVHCRDLQITSNTCTNFILFVSSDIILQYGPAVTFAVET